MNFKVILNHEVLWIPFKLFIMIGKIRISTTVSAMCFKIVRYSGVLLK